MSTILQFGNVSRSLLAVLCIGGGLVACTTQEAAPSGTGGSTPGAGGTATGTGGAGAAGSSGATTGLGTLCPPPQQVITSFTYTPSDAGTADTTSVRFGSAGSLQGGTSYYGGAGATSPLTSDVTKNNWHITGTVGDYSGFALYFDSGATPCDRVDASQFKGISFKISGSVPHGGSVITFGVGTVKDTPSGTWMISPGGKTSAKATDVGSCTPTSGTQYYHPGCGDPTIQIPVTADPVVQNIPWADLTGGTPLANPDPSGITSIYWYFPWTGSNDTAYAVDFTIDDLSFIQ